MALLTDSIIIKNGASNNLWLQTDPTGLGIWSKIPGKLGELIGANFNITTDQSITTPSSYLIRRIVVTNSSTSLTLAAGGFYTGASKSGTTIVTAAQVYSGLTTSTKFVDITLAGGCWNRCS